jgi:hypothetical protein
MPSRIDRGASWRVLTTTSRTLVSINAPARIAVVRVNKFAVVRPVINPDIPPPPMPSAPPSLFCSRITPTSDTATNTCTTSKRTKIIKTRPGRSSDVVRATGF